MELVRMASDLKAFAATESQLELLDFIQRRSFKYFLDYANPHNGLVADSTVPAAPSSIAAVGLALGCYACGAERGFITFADAVERTLTTLRFLHGSHQGPEPDASGYQGFYYHFLDRQTGQRHGQCELSTIDSGHLLIGALLAATYFGGEGPGGREIRTLADDLYRRVDWPWACNGGPALSHGWHPESGFIAYRWTGYDEAQFLYILGLGSPTHPLEPASYAAWTSAFHWGSHYGLDYLHAGPLFIHQASHLWLDLRGIRDTFMRARGIDYFENTRRAIRIQQRYAIDNPQRWADYGEYTWGITASEEPGEHTLVVDGVERRFHQYLARGVPEPDDGTLSPWVVIAALPFDPAIVLPTIEHFSQAYPELMGDYGFTCSLNPTFRNAPSVRGRVTPSGWLSSNYFGLNQGPNVLMIENYRSAFTWPLMQRCTYLVKGLRRAGFSGGWLATP
jgi:hypothetical protein